MLHHMALLVAFDREDALIGSAVGVMSDGSLKRSVELLQPVLKDVVEPDEQRGLQISGFQPLQQVHQVKRTAAITARLDHNMPSGIDREIGCPPALKAVELRALCHGPGPFRSGLSHEPVRRISER